MTGESTGKFLLKGFEVDKGILFRVIERPTSAAEIAQNHASTFNPGFYYGIIRAIQKAEDSADIMSAEIHIIDTVDMNKGNMAGCFRNMIMTEGDDNLDILQIVDKKPVRSYIYAPPIETQEVNNI